MFKKDRETIPGAEAWEFLRRFDPRLSREHMPERIHLSEGKKMDVLNSTDLLGGSRHIMAIDYSDLGEDMEHEGMLTVALLSRPKMIGRVDVPIKTWTSLDIVETPEGILIKNAQSYRGRRHAEKVSPRNQTAHNAFLDSKMGMRLGLEYLKQKTDKPIFITQPHEQRKEWGKWSSYFLRTSGFWKYVRREYPKEFKTLMRRAFFEHPVFAEDYYRDIGGGIDQSGNFTPEEVAEVKRHLSEVKYAKGRNLLRRRMGEFLGSEHGKEGRNFRSPFGKRASKSYYRDIPLQHGFVEEKKPIDFGEHGSYHVLSYRHRK